VYSKGAVIQNSEGIYAADRAAVRALNARGGLAGRKVLLVGCNEKGDPNETVKCGRLMVSEHVAAVMGGALNNGTQLNEVLVAANIPQIGLNPQAPGEFNAKNAYLFNGGGLFGWQILAAFAAKNKVVTSAISSDAPTAKPFLDLVEASAVEAGAKFSNTVLVPATTADYAPIVAAATSNHATASIVLVGLEQTKQVVAANQAGGAKLSKLLTAFYLTKKDSAQLGGIRGLQSVLIGSPYPPFATSSNAMMVQFRKELAAEKASGDGDAVLERIDVASFSGWLAFQALEQLAKTGKLKASQLNTTGIARVLDATKNLNLKGVIPPWTPTKAGPQYFGRVPNTANYVIGFNAKGNPFLITPKPLTVAEIAAGKGPQFPK
jgi:ABC-type branched-subunit amino acid transport system substrate-binding protein